MGGGGGNQNFCNAPLAEWVGGERKEIEGYKLSYL